MKNLIWKNTLEVQINIILTKPLTMYTIIQEYGKEGINKYISSVYIFICSNWWKKLWYIDILKVILMENMKIYYFHKVVVIIGCPNNYKGFRKEVSSLWMALQHSKICCVLITTQWPLPFFKAYKLCQWPCHHHPLTHKIDHKYNVYCIPTLWIFKEGLNRKWERELSDVFILMSDRRRRLSVCPCMPLCVPSKT